jgi:hypothetical protein
MQSASLTDSLEPRQLFAAAAAGPMAAFADFNGDGKADLVLVNKSAGDGAAGPHLTVQLGNGDGTFAAPAAVLDLAALPKAVAAGDLTADGLADIAVVGKGKGGSAVRTFVNAGGGTSFTEQDVIVPATATAARLVDMDVDGRADLVALAKGKTAVAFGAGDGTFLPDRPVASSIGNVLGNGPALADVNGDAVPDLVGFNKGVARVAIGGTNGVFSPAVVADIGLAARKDAKGAYNVAAQDADGDAVPDIVLLPTGKTGSVFIARGLGDGVFAKAVEGFIFNGSVGPTFTGPGFSPLTRSPLAVARIDSDDARADLIGFTASPTSAAPLAFVASGNGKGFGKPILATSFIATTTTSIPVAGDTDGDGKADLVNVVTGKGSSLRVQRGQGDGVFDDPFFTAVAASVLPTGSELRVADFSGDGKDDVLVVQPPKAGTAALTTNLFVSVGDGTFQPPATRVISDFTGGVFASGRLVAIDANTDGKADLLYVTPPAATNPGAILASITDGTSNNAAVVLDVPAVPSNQRFDAFQAGDVNGDDLPDLVGLVAPEGNVLRYVQLFGDASTRLVDGALRFTGTGNLGGATPSGGGFATGAQPLIADFNGDGRADLAVINHDAAGAVSPVFIAVAQSNGSYATAVKAADFFSPSGGVASVGDVDGDGKPDLLSGSKSGTIAAVVFTLSNGNGTFGKLPT